MFRSFIKLAFISPFQMTGDGLISSTGLITYDALGQRMRVKNFGIGDNQDFALDQLMLFREVVKPHYTVDVLCFFSFIMIPPTSKSI